MPVADRAQVRGEGGGFVRPSDADRQQRDERQDRQRAAGFHDCTAHCCCRSSSPAWADWTAPSIQPGIWLTCSPAKMTRRLPPATRGKLRARA